MPELIEELDQRVGLLRDLVRQALLAGDRERTRTLRAELRRAEQAWHEAIELADADAEVAGPGAVPAGRAGQRPGPSPALLPLREQVHQVLTLLTVPAGPRLISAAHEALFAGAIPAARLTSVRRDEERSFRAAPFARPYYLCAALTADLLAPARGLLAVSTWPMERRIIGPLSPRVDYLTAAVQIAESIQRIAEPSVSAMRLLARLAANIPGAAAQAWARADPAAVARAARSELSVHADADAEVRESAAARARRQLDDAQQLFGAGLRSVSDAQA